MNIEQLAQLHGQDFPGYELVDAYEAAFPSYMLHLEVLMEVKRPLPVLEEYILKAVDAGQITVEDIANLLGLEHAAVELGLDLLQRRNYVFFQIPQNGGRSIPIQLTPKGRIVLRDLFLTEPEASNFPVCMDALTGSLYPSFPLRQPNEIREQDLHEVPTFVPMPKAPDLHYPTLKKFVRDSQKDNELGLQRRELVELLGIEKSWTAYRVMRILQFIRQDDNALQIQVYDRGERSMELEAVLLKMEAEKRRPLRAMLQKEIPPIDPDALSVIDPDQVQAAKKKAEEAPRIIKEIENQKKKLEDIKQQQSSELVEERREAQYSFESLTEQIARLEAQILKMEKDAGETQSLQMHEHRPKLVEALQQAKYQVLIVSPWLKPDAVDYELRQEISTTLKRGVNVVIGYGFGESDHQEERVVRKLKELRTNKKGSLKLYRVGDVHSKVLICDDRFMILSSYNWLSFAGDPNRGSRVEDGMLTTNKKAIAIKTEEWLARLQSLPET